MTSDVKNVKLGPCAVSLGGTDLGYTSGGVEVTISTSTKKVTVDQFGDTAVDEYITGRSVTVTVPLAEFDLTKIVTVIPGATLVSGSSKKKIVIDSGVGHSLRDLAVPLILHPIAVPANDVSQDVTVHLAAPMGDFKFAYKVDDERIYNVEFGGYVDTANSNRLVTIGDMTATAGP